jgi:putative ABC transport system ATP-binding protein
MELLRTSCDDLKQSIVVVTHDPRAAAYADRVVFLRDGRLDGELLFSTDATLAEKLHQIIERMSALGD